MPPEVIVAEGEPPTPSADEAERANAAANQATQAAVAASALAEVQAANVTQAAADRMAEFEAELSQWRGLKERQEAQTAEYAQHRQAIETRLNEMAGQLSQIHEKLATPPASPPSPEQNLNEPPTAGEAEPPPEPPRPPAERRKAHRWI